MKYSKCFAKLLAGLFIVLMAVNTHAKEVYPLEYWALRAVINNVEISPDGKYLSLMKTPNRDSNPQLEIYDASDLSKKPFILNSDPMEAVGYGWVGDENVVVSFRQKVRNKIDGFNQGAYERKIGLLDVKRKTIKEFRESNPRISNVLVNKAGKILIAFQPETKKSGGDPRFHPLDYFELDLKRGSKKLVMRGKISQGGVRFTADGEPWTAQSFDVAKGEFIWLYRQPGHSKWEEIYRLSEDSFEQFSIQGIDDTKPDTLFVVAENGKNTAGLWEFNTRTKQFGELIYARTDVNVSGVTTNTNRWSKPDIVSGVAYRSDKLHREFFDPEEGALYAQLQKSVPNAHDIYITSRTRDGNKLTVFNSGPKDPGTYYLVEKGKILKIGSKQPLMKAEDLSEVKYIKYKSRDGKTIHAYLTVPQGKGPFPTIVLPHGGPFVPETVGYDEWGQMLANNGYMVLQPEYRGSTNYGLKFYESAFLPKGQGGYKMQDDKDDGAMYLVRQGLADKDRIAMFGWSYGGYAALIAASRTPQIYQCVIAGAAVSDTLMQVSYYRARLRGARKLEQINMWSGSIDPIKEVAKVNVPILLIHGSIDQRVPQEHVRRYRDQLEKYGKPYKYVELKGADHFYSTLFFDHKILLYSSIIDYLKNDCGPGGL